MITLLLGTIYGVGFGLSIVGGTLYLMVLNGLHSKPNPIKFLSGIILWPIAWVTLGYKLYKMSRE